MYRCLGVFVGGNSGGGGWKLICRSAEGKAGNAEGAEEKRHAEDRRDVL